MWISSIVATPNGLAAIHKDGKISYGDVEQGEWGQWNLWDGSYDSRRRVSCAAAPDERSRVLGTRDGLLILEERGGSSSRVEAHKASVETVAITPDGAVVVSGAADGTIAVLRPRLSLNSQLILGHRDPVRVLALDPSGNFAVSGSAADDLTVWRLPELTRVAGFHCDGKIEDIALAAGASFVVIADGAGSVHLLSKMQGSEALEPASTSHGPQPV
jgi:WD40 repeat protein